MELSALGRCHPAILNALHAGIAAGGIIYPAAVAAYPVPVDFGGKLVRWKIESTETPVYFETVNDSTLADATAGGMVREAAELWSAVDGSLLRLSEVKSPTDPVAKITVHFESNFDGGDFAAAYAAFDRTTGSGDPVHCTVKVAVRGTEALPDLEKTVLHEFGHCLGLGHSLFPKAIMSYRLEQNAFQLDVDDEAALRGLYPESGKEAALPPGCSIGRPANAVRRNLQTPAMIDFFWVLLALFPAIVRWLTARRLRG